MAGTMLALTMVILTIFVSSVMGNDVDTVAPYPRDINAQLDSGMWPVYDMWTVFISGVVQWRYLFWMEDRLGTKFTTLDDFTAAFTTETVNEWIMYFIGFFICAAVGVVTFIGMWITCIFLPICRCCGKCGRQKCKCCMCGRKSSSDSRPKSPPKELTDGKRSKQNRIGYSISIAVFMCMCIWGVTCIFIVNERISEQLSGEQSIFDQISTNLLGLEHYLDTTVDDLNQTAYVDYEKTKNAIFLDLENMPQHVMVELEAETTIVTTYAELYNFSDALPEMNETLYQVDAQSIQIQDLSANLNLTLNALKNDIKTELSNNCTSPECTDASEAADQLAVSSDYTVVDVTNATITVNITLAGDFVELVEYIGDNLTQIMNVTEEAIEDELEKAKHETDQVGQEILNAVNSVDESLNSIDFDSINRTMADVEETVVEKHIHDYVYWSVVSLGSMLCLIIFCTVVGLFCNCCRRPQEGDSCTDCTREQGARCLLTSVGLTLGFFWVYAIVVLITFAAGGAIYSEVCRNVIEYNSSDSSKVLNILDSWVNHSLYDSVTMEIKPFDIYKQCAWNRSLYIATNLETKFNISELIDIEAVEEMIEDIKGQEIEIGDIELYNDVLDGYLLFLEQGLVQSLDFEAMENELKKSVTTSNLTELAEMLELLGISSLNDEIETLRNLSANEVQEINTLRFSILDGLTQIQNILGNISFVETGHVLNDTELFLDEEGDILISGVINGTADASMVDVENLATRVEKGVTEDVGKCRPVYDSMTGVMDAGCVQALYPLNGLWFCMGWCMFFLFITFIMALKLVTLMRKTRRYSKGMDIMDEMDRYSDDTRRDHHMDDPNKDIFTDMATDEGVLLEPVPHHRNFGYKLPMTTMANPVFEFEDPDKPLNIPRPFVEQPPRYDDVPAVAPPVARIPSISRFSYAPAPAFDTDVFLRQKYGFDPSKSSDDSPPPDY